MWVKKRISEIVQVFFISSFPRYLDDNVDLQVGEGDNCLARLAWNIQDATQVRRGGLLRPTLPDGKEIVECGKGELKLSIAWNVHSCSRISTLGVNSYG